MYLCHGCYQGAEAASAMKKRPGREALALSIYIFISFFSGIIFLWYHFSPVPFLYDYIPEPARTNLIFSRAFYLTVPCTYHVRIMYAPCPSAKKLREETYTVPSRSMITIWSLSFLWSRSILPLLHRLFIHISHIVHSQNFLCNIVLGESAAALILGRKHQFIVIRQQDFI